MLLADNDSYQIGTILGNSLHTFGHTPACIRHIVGHAIFVANTVFLLDGDAARPDFLGGDTRTLYKSIEKILLPQDTTRLFVFHDYMPTGRAVFLQTKVAEQKRKNIHVSGFIKEADFVKLFEDREVT